jgi:hypothetical protein
MFFIGPTQIPDEAEHHFPQCMGYEISSTGTMNSVYIQRIATATPPHDVHGAFIEYASGMLYDRRARSVLSHMVLRASYFGFRTIALAARWHHFVRNYEPVSICRAFLPAEWRLYAEAAGIPTGSVHIDIRWPARLCVARMKKP